MVRQAHHERILSMSKDHPHPCLPAPVPTEGGAGRHTLPHLWGGKVNKVKSQGKQASELRGDGSGLHRSSAFEASDGPNYF